MGGVFIEYVILGFLLLRSLTQYDLKKVLETKVSPFFSASLGSIQAALKKLEGNRHVEMQETVVNGRRKKIYTITGSGQTYFMAWMLSPVTARRLESEAATRVFFMGLLPQSDRLTICRMIVDELEKTIKEYQDTQSEFANRKIPESFKTIAVYQMKTLDMGLFYHMQMLAWFTNLYMEIAGETNG